jgi:WD40 repeat protein
VLIWSADAEPIRFDPGSVVMALAFSPDGNSLAVGDDGGHITILSVPEFSVQFQVSDKGGIRALTWASDSRHFAAGGVSACCTVWAIDQPPPCFRSARRDDWITGLSFSPLGLVLAIAGFGHEVELVQLEESEAQRFESLLLDS